MIKIGDHQVGAGRRPLVIAELSGNHHQSLARALKLVDAAAGAGAHALKLQTYKPDTMTIDEDSEDFVISDADSPWSGRSLYDLYEEAHTPWEWHEALFDRARKHGMIAFSTPFDETAVQFLEGLEVPCYKIASFENAHLPLIRTVAATGKPIFLSTGMATVAELDEAVRTARGEGCRDLVLLKCTSSYPTPSDDANIATIPHLRDLFNCEVGLSDHTLGIGVAVAATAHGACAVEKHLTIRRADGGVDSAFSMEPDELRALVLETERAWRSLGRIQYGTTSVEASSIQFRRSIYAVADIAAGDVLTSENIGVIRPGYGLHPRFFETLLGRQASQDIGRGTPLKWEMF